jgi:hypothetical protein
MGTHWELEGNMLGQRKNEKNPYPRHKTRKKKIKALSMHAKPSHLLHEISIPKTIHHIFGLGIIVMFKLEKYLIVL